MSFGELVELAKECAVFYIGLAVVGALFLMGLLIEPLPRVC